MWTRQLLSHHCCRARAVPGGLDLAGVIRFVHCCLSCFFGCSCWIRLAGVISRCVGYRCWHSCCGRGVNGEARRKMKKGNGLPNTKWESPNSTKKKTDIEYRDNLSSVLSSSVDIFIFNFGYNSGCTTTVVHWLYNTSCTTRVIKKVEAVADRD